MNVRGVIGGHPVEAGPAQGADFSRRVVPSA